MSTTLSVIGTIASDPKLIHPPSGVALCSFRIASDERWFDKSQQSWNEGHTNWFGIVCFRGLATHALESFRKGERVIVHGKLRVRKWEKDGRQGTSVEIEADAIGHDVRFGVSRFEKRVGGQAMSRGEAEEPNGPEQAAAHPDSSSGDGTHRADPSSYSVNSVGERSADGFTPDTQSNAA